MSGSGADTIGFAGSRLFDSGLPWWFDDTAYSLTIGPIPLSSVGKTICLDSAFFPPSGVWAWSVAQVGTFHPSWDGPHCYEVGADTTLLVSGQLSYLNPRYSPPNDEFPMRDIEVQLWDKDWDFDDLLAVTTTNDDGDFSFDTVSNIDYGGAYGQDIYLKIFAHNDAGFVTTNTILLTKWYTVKEPVIQDVSSGTYDYGTFVTNLGTSGAFHIVDRLLDGYRMWLDSTFIIREDIGGCPVYLDDSCGSYYTSPPLTADYLVIDTSDYSLLRAPDTYDDHVILHEHGHWVGSHCLDVFDESSGGPHTWSGKYSPALAASEGFAHFWSSVVRGDASGKNWWLNFALYRETNVENGEHGWDGTYSNSANNYGDSCEAAVAGILWDICDPDSDDYDSFGDFSFPRGPADDIGDSLSDGFQSILSALLDDDVLGHRPDNMGEFWDVWVGPPSLGNKQKVADIYYEHGDSTRSCCYGIRGNVDGDLWDQIDINDLLYLVDFMFTGGPEAPCWEEANLRADDSTIDISDLVWLVDYMFTGGPAPHSCYDKKLQTD
ncbi:MAG: transthyretin-like family protein [candidate division Zixibacteria bacterium]|nr:transthyretin-like family protein [candidate division Zixibacteria bacterium]MDH4035498.1 transthyretin-like family protein [candidate division Zixibacteria bacterium]